MIIDEEEYDDYLAHYGVLRRSGRYPWGSGGPEVANNKSFLDYVDLLEKQGLTQVEICEGMKIGTTDREGNFHPSTTQLRAAKSIARNAEKLDQINMAQKLHDKGYKNGAIAERMGLAGESSVRALLAPGAADKANVLFATSKMLEKEVAEHKYVDVGSGVEVRLGITHTKLNTSVAILREKGYEVRYIKEPQIGTGKDTTHKVLAAPGTSWSEVQQNRALIHQPMSTSDDAGHTFSSGKIHEPISIHPDRVAVRHAEEGGIKFDGIIYVRPGVEDVSLGGNRYGQVRIKIGDKHFAKGMAMYKDDLPKGVDLLINSAKKNTGNKLDALKPLEDDPDLPFGSVVRQILKNEGTPNEHVTSAMNIIGTKEGSGVEGGWGRYSKTLSSQVLSKQSPVLAKGQLDLTFERRQQELADIMALTNPTVKKKLLESFADSTDSAAVHLKAAALPRQQTRVILPMDSLPEHQVYAPTFRNGEKVVLIRHPHAGPFEIPELTVNNKHEESRRLLGDNLEDAIGIHHKVAERLSGADFDGDFVLVIPNRLKQIKTSPALEGLKDFEPHRYKIPEDPDRPGHLMIPKIDKDRMQQEMGLISNLITDMNLRQASQEELSRAVRHSMVVIDSEKHGLNYKQSERDHGIVALRRQYQRSGRGGASTLISSARSQTRIPERAPRPHPQGGPIDKATGKRVFVETGRRDKEGEIVKRKFKKLEVTEDAHDLSSGTPMERIYADHSNRLKALADEARKVSLTVPRLVYSSSAKKAYASQVESLDAKLQNAIRNQPLERKAQRLANAVVRAKKEAHPDIDKDDLKKIKFQALAEARLRTGAGKQRIDISPDEWDAIQAGAITDTKLGKILTNTDPKRIRELATPREQHVMTSSMKNRAEAMLGLGYTQAEVIDALGVSLSTLNRSLKGE